MQHNTNKHSYPITILLLIIILVAGLSYASLHLNEKINVSNNESITEKKMGLTTPLESKDIVSLKENKKVIAPEEVHEVMTFKGSKKDLYLYEPKYLKEALFKLDYKYQNYRDTVDQFIHMNVQMKLKLKTIHTLDNLQTSDILILLESLSLSKEDRTIINTFVKNGGQLIFNSHAGFRDEKIAFTGDTFIKNITGLTHLSSYSLEENQSIFATPKLLSPLTKHLGSGPALSLVLYDALPLFSMQKERSADLYLTDWAQVSYPIVKDKMIARESSGLVWSGSYGKGKWIYFSFPLYAFFESLEDNESFANLYRGMLEYLNYNMIVRTYPYLDSKSISFVSEDTEFRFENLRQFSDLSLKYKIPVAALCVAYLAKENLELMSYVKENPYLTFGSHSYMHQKIVGTSDENYRLETQGSREALQQITQRDIYGFRPPREEVDTKLLTLLAEGGYSYVLNNIENRLYPYFLDTIMVIPRHGTDDFTYLVKNEWAPDVIIEKMIQESKVLQELNGIYSMSTHTHLMNYSTNIAILEDYFKYLKTEPGIVSLSGKMIYDRIRYLKKISLLYENNMITITNKNQESIDNYTFRIYAQNKISSVNSKPISTNLLLTNVADGIYDVIIKEMNPNAQIVLFIE